MPDKMFLAANARICDAFFLGIFFGRERKSRTLSVRFQAGSLTFFVSNQPFLDQFFGRCTDA
jgi:hypothetical protein